MRRPDRQTIFLITALIMSATILAFVVFRSHNGEADARRPNLRSPKLADIPFDGTNAYKILQEICALGRRVSGSQGMQQQQELLGAHFAQLGGAVQLQKFRARHPQTGAPVELANLIVQWHPERTERVLLCAHYDTRPFPDQDPNPALRRGVFVGANDGASGTALLAEMGRHMPQLASPLGVDFVLFDGEEFVFDEGDEYFLGSSHFAREYVQNPPGHRYRCAILFDMVADQYLQIYQEQHSMRWRDSRPLVLAIWRTARKLGVREFISAQRHLVRDDHLPLHEIAKIPACDIIDFDYGPAIGRGNYWHTTQDTPDKCSALSLAKVGWVTLEWLKTLK